MKELNPVTCNFAGAPEGIRTPNLLIRSQGQHIPGRPALSIRSRRARRSVEPRPTRSKRLATTWLPATILTAVLSAVALALLWTDPAVPFNTLVGQCPTASSDPTAVCYVPPATHTDAAAAALADAATVADIGQHHGCAPTLPAGTIPYAVIMRMPDGQINYVEFGAAWQIVHQAAPTHVFELCTH